ncbi:TPA: RNA 2',3'-cyclic phosphodiesterase [Candidatus Woesearchaeota archaeon]|nr:RNA 2',3'-cyclic phosphodiesterase [Candidatus Woesearchaeota archaeon]
MRIFIAFDIPEKHAPFLKKLQEKIKDGARLTTVKEFHQTMKFLGEVDEAKTEEIKKRLEAVKMEGFEARIEGLGVFPEEEYIKVVWAGLEPKEVIGLLKTKIEDSLKGLGFQNDHRFHPHITLARVKSINDKKGFVKRLKEIKMPETRFRVDSIKLYKSTLTPRGPEYEVLKEYKLKGQ